MGRVYKRQVIFVCIKRTGSNGKYHDLKNISASKPDLLAFTPAKDY